MALTNLEIIESNIILHGITEEVDTYAGWSRNGYRVKRGSKALFKTKIWKPCKTKEDSKYKGENHLFLVNAAFFGRSQVEEIKK